MNDENIYPYQLKPLEENDPRSYQIQLKGAAAMREYARDRKAVRKVLAEALDKPITPKLERYVFAVLGEEYEQPKTIGTGITCWIIWMAERGDKEALQILADMTKSSTVKAFVNHQEKLNRLIDIARADMLERPKR